MEQIVKTEEKMAQQNLPPSIDASRIIGKILSFLKLFMCETLAKRLLSMVLIAVGVPNDRVTELTGLCDKSVRTLKKALANGELDDQFHVGGGGRKRKLVDVEAAIVEEINNNNYHSYQQIADMIQEKHGLKVSVSTVSRLLKKRHQALEVWLAACESRPREAACIL